MIKYRADYWNDPVIEKVEVVKESDSSVWLPNGKVERKKTNSCHYFGTFQEAKEFLTDMWKNKLGWQKKHTATINERLHRIMKMTEAK